jgi:hypothetical protein
MKTRICWIGGLVAVRGFTAPYRRNSAIWLPTRSGQLDIYLCPDPQGCKGFSEGFPEARLETKTKEEKQPPTVFHLKEAKATLEAKQQAKNQATTATADAENALAQFEAAIEAVLQIEQDQVEEAAKTAAEKASRTNKAEQTARATTRVEMGQQADVVAHVQPIDVSIPYDAPAKLAYEASDKSMAYADFKVKYEADAVAHVVSKQPIDVSIPYDAPAKLAYEASDKSMAYGDFKVKYEADAVAHVVSKQTIDVSIPYDAPAKLAYEASDKSMAYADFKVKYEADAVAYVVSKQPIDVSIPDDAPAKLAYEHSDKSMAYVDFKQKYKNDAVASVISKKNRVKKELKDQKQPPAPTDVTKAKSLDKRDTLATKGIQTYTDSLAPEKFAKMERKDGEPIPPQLRVLSAGYMDQLQKAAQNNPLVLKDELEKRRVVEDDEADPAR